MGFLYCITSKILKINHYKIGMTLYKDEAKMIAYLLSRYGTAYGCCVNIVLFKQVGNPRVAEKNVQEALKQYCECGEIYNCELHIIQAAFDGIPETEDVVSPQKLTVVEAIKKNTSVPHDFIDVFFASYDDAEQPNHPYLDLDVLAQFMGVNKKTLFKTLRESYEIDKDYSVQKKPKRTSNKYGGNNHKEVLVTMDCMKRLCMKSRTSKADVVRERFIEIENFMLKTNKHKLAKRS